MGLCFSNENDITIVEPKTKRPLVLQPLTHNSLYKERTFKLSPLRNSVTTTDSVHGISPSLTPKKNISRKRSESPSTEQSSEAEIDKLRKRFNDFKNTKGNSVTSIDSDIMKEDSALLSSDEQ